MRELQVRQGAGGDARPGVVLPVHGPAVGTFQRVDRRGDVTERATRGREPRQQLTVLAAVERVLQDGPRSDEVRLRQQRVGASSCSGDVRRVLPAHA